MEILLLWLVFAICGAIIGGRRNAALGGCLLGVLLGPLGCLVALGLDHRAQCPLCGGRLEVRRPAMCPHCRSSLWDGRVRIE